MSKEKNDRELQEAMRQLFDPTTIDPNIEQERRWIARLQGMRAEAEQTADEGRRARIIEFCERAIEDAEKNVREYEKIKEKKAENRDELVRIINSLTE